jgi:hypothetical protein
VPGFLVLLNVYDQIFYSNATEDGKKVYSSTFSSTWDHLRKQNWVFDKDPFNVNQFAHPYQGGSETIVRVKTGFTVRVYRRHGLGLEFVESIRDSQYGNLPSTHQSDGTVTLVYTFLGDSHFGAVEWRDDSR